MNTMTKMLALLTTTVVLLCDTFVNAQISVAFSLALVGDGQLMPNERERKNFDRVIDLTIKKANEEAKVKGWPQLDVPNAADASGSTSGWKAYVSDENGNVVEFDDADDERRQLAAEEALPLPPATQGRRGLCRDDCIIMCNAGAFGNWCECCGNCCGGERRTLRALIESDEDLQDMAHYMRDEALELMKKAWRHHKMCVFQHEDGYELEVILVRDIGDGTEIKSNGQFKPKKKNLRAYDLCKLQNKENKVKKGWKKLLEERKGGKKQSSSSEENPDSDEE